MNWLKTAVELAGLVADVIASSQPTREHVRRIRLEIAAEERAFRERVRRSTQK